MSGKSDKKMPRKKEPPTRTIRTNEEIYDGLTVLSAIHRKSVPKLVDEILKPIVVAALDSHGIAFPVQSQPERMAELVQKAVASGVAGRAKTKKS